MGGGGGVGGGWVGGTGRGRGGNLVLMLCACVRARCLFCRCLVNCSCGLIWFGLQVPRLVVDLESYVGFRVSADEAKSRCRELDRCGKRLVLPLQVWWSESRQFFMFCLTSPESQPHYFRLER